MSRDRGVAQDRWESIVPPSILMLDRNCNLASDSSRIKIFIAVGNRESMTIMANPAFRFLLWDDNQPYRSSKCYIVADPSINDRKQWTLQLDPPEDASWFYEIDDVKDWMLHGKPKRQIIFDRSDRHTPYRDLEREEVFREYLRKIVERLPTAYQSRRKYALMPSIADDNTRTRYKNAVEAAIPDVTILPEPEMVAEYFRLLQRDLELASGRNNVLLVIDVGASTANMTLIVSRRDSTIVDVDRTGAQRDLRLRALRGDSDNHAGRWVDRRLAEISLLDLSDASLRQIEHAKIIASLGSAETPSADSMAHPVIDRAMLTSVSSELWAELHPLFVRLCERLYENQTFSEDARRKSQELLGERQVKKSGDAHRLIDTILLAGGTSLLPGFEAAMLATLFPDDHRPEVLRVGSSFAVAAAAGGLAHILHNYAPSRLREASGPTSESFSAPLEATLPHPLLLGIKQMAEREHYIPLLDPDDPFVDDGGKRPIYDLPPFAEGSKPKTRIVPALTAGVEARRGRKFRSMLVRQSPGRMELDWDPVREKASISSEQVDGTSHLWIDVGGLRKREEAVLDPFDEPLPANALAVDAAEDVIFDFGMSKIVALTADRGWISTGELERIIDEGDLISALQLTAAEADAQFDLSEATDAPIPDNPELDPDYLQRPPLAGGEAPKDGDPSSDLVESESRALSIAPLREDPAAAVSTTSSGTVTPKELVTSSDWNARIEDSEFSNALTSLRDTLEGEIPKSQFDDIVVALLALSIRPVVLLAGPPGCGKSTLVRLIARMMGKRAGDDFHDVAVQAHWVNDDALFGKMGALDALSERPETAHLVLFDEFNLTRPEYYMSRLFHALDGGSDKLLGDETIRRCRVLGTLNIDESSRPPSPKVLDRCFLLELSPVPFEMESPRDLPDLSSITPLAGLPTVSMNGPVADERIDGVLRTLQKAVVDHDLREDLLPSRRVLSDIRASLSLHNRLDLQGKGLLDRSELVDRLIASRILIKLSGAFDQLKPALGALETYINDVEELRRARHRLRLARQQSRLGFVSPWQ